MPRQAPRLPRTAAGRRTCTAAGTDARPPACLWHAVYIRTAWAGVLLTGATMCLAAVLAVAAGGVLAVPSAWGDGHDGIEIIDEALPPSECSVSVAHAPLVTSVSPGDISQPIAQTFTNTGVRNFSLPVIVGARDWVIDPDSFTEFGAVDGGRGLLDSYLTDVAYVRNGTYHDMHSLYTQIPGPRLAVGESVDLWFRVDLSHIPALLADRMVQRVGVHVQCVDDPAVLPNGTVLPPVDDYHLQADDYFAHVAMIEQAPNNATGGPVPATPGNATGGPPVAGPTAGLTSVAVREDGVVIGTLPDGTLVNLTVTFLPEQRVGRIVIEFRNSEHVNYDIVATQGGRAVLEDIGNHDHDGVNEHRTAPLMLVPGEHPLYVTVTFNGYGIDEMTGVAGVVVFAGNATGPPIATVPIVVDVAGLDPAEPVNVTSDGVAANVMIDVAGLAGSMLDGTAPSTVTFPPSETTVVASFATVSFPPGVTAAHVPADGLLNMRISVDVPADDRVQDALGYEGSGRVTLQRVVEVGSGSGRITFDVPVRIFLEGQAGGRAFYIDGADGVIVPIDEACAADDVDRVHGQLEGAGECHIDSADGGKVIYTYHLTRFGTALPELAAPLPTIHTCSVGIGTDDLNMRAAPGAHSEPVRQVVSNRGTLPLERVDLVATPWLMGYGGGSQAGADPLPPVPPVAVPSVGEGRAWSVLTARIAALLPASVTEVLEVDAGGGGYMAVDEGTAVARGLEGGDAAPLLFRVNLTPHDGLSGGTMSQNVTYQATCAPP